MACLISKAPGAFTVINLDQNAFWRVTMGGDIVDQTPALALNVIYPPGMQFRPVDGAAIPTVVALAKVPITLAQSTNEAARVAQVALAGGNLETDRQRLREAFEMFKNNPRAPRQESIEQAANDAMQLLDLYWQIAGWFLEGASSKWEQQILQTEVQGRP